MWALKDGSIEDVVVDVVTVDAVVVFAGTDGAIVVFVAPLIGDPQKIAMFGEDRLETGLQR